MELLDSTEKLVEAQSQITKLQTCVDSILKERVQTLSGLSALTCCCSSHFRLLSVDLISPQFGDLDPGSADFFLQEERIKQLRAGYEAQYRVTESKK